MLWVRIWFVVLVTASLFGQNAGKAAKPAADAHVVRIRMSDGGGMGCYMYCTSTTTVEPSKVVVELRDSPNKKKYPNRKETRMITKREWQELVRSIDPTALRAVPQDSRCLPCIDIPQSFLTIEYSDESKISVGYSPGRAPATVSAIKIPAVQISLTAR